MLVTDARKEVESIDREIARLYVRRAELQLYVDYQNAQLERAMRDTSQQMNDWWNNLQRSQKIE